MHLRSLLCGEIMSYSSILLSSQLAWGHFCQAYMVFGCVSVFGALVYIDVDKAAIKALLTLMYIPLKDT